MNVWWATGFSFIYLWIKGIMASKMSNRAKMGTLLKQLKSVAIFNMVVAFISSLTVFGNYVTTDDAFLYSMVSGVYYYSLLF